MPDSQFVPLTPLVDVEQRETVRRGDDRKLYGFVLTLIVTAFSVGVAWATTTALIHQKLDKTEQLAVDKTQDARTAALEGQFSLILGAMHDMKTSVDSANLRLRQMACDGKPMSCR
jgi:hypothetical protein